MSRATSTTIRATTGTSTRTTTPRRSSSTPPRLRSGQARPLVLALVAGWSLFAFGGAYLWTLVPLFAGALWLAAVTRPPIASSGTRTVDLALCLCLLLVALQLVPMPARARLAVSPGLAKVESSLYLDRTQTAASGPLTVDAAATAESLAVAVALILVFWSARALFEGGALRRTIRGVAMCGLVAAAVSIVQHATAPKLLYWVWRPVAAGAPVYGPFVSRNDLATWLVMAIPLTLGYMVARVESRRGGLERPALAAAIDAPAVWLAAAVFGMTAALLASLSRSGLTAGAVALLTFVLLSRGRMARRHRGWLVLGLVGVIVVAAAYTNMGAMMVRLNDALANGVGGRRDIWTWTRTIIADFWLVGVGVGAYARAMSVYQPPHLFAYNHAHDEYLQVVAEGGVVLAAAAIVAVLAGMALAARRLAGDRTPMFWARAGAVSGLAAVAVQSIWETGLRMPANGVLFAICAAVAVHRGRDGRT